MTNEERKELKRNLDQAITKMIREFENKTGLTFTGVNSIDNSKVCGGSETVHVITSFEYKD